MPVILVTGKVKSVHHAGGVMSDVMSVQQKEGKIRQKPSFLGKIISRVPYGTKLEIIKEQGAWYNVKSGSTSGWINKSSLTEKEIILKAGDERVSSDVDDDELVLAGKGFNKQVEQGHQQNNPKLNYGLVDQMEAYEVSPTSVETFIQSGGLKNV